MKERTMGIGISLLFLAAGAVMAWAIEVENAEGFNVNTVGIILMVVGAIGLVVALAIGASGRGDRTTIVED